MTQEQTTLTEPGNSEGIKLLETHPFFEVNQLFTETLQAAHRLHLGSSTDIEAAMANSGVSFSNLSLEDQHNEPDPVSVNNPPFHVECFSIPDLNNLFPQGQGGKLELRYLSDRRGLGEKALDNITFIWQAGDIDFSLKIRPYNEDRYDHAAPVLRAQKQVSQNILLQRETRLSHHHPSDLLQVREKGLTCDTVTSLATVYYRHPDYKTHNPKNYISYKNGSRYIPDDTPIVTSQRDSGYPNSYCGAQASVAYEYPSTNSDNKPKVVLAQGNNLEPVIQMRLENSKTIYSNIH